MGLEAQLVVRKCYCLGKSLKGCIWVLLGLSNFGVKLLIVRVNGGNCVYALK
jgi:hypothetical protein